MDAATFSVPLSPDATAVVLRAPGTTSIRLTGEIDECAVGVARSLVDLVVERGSTAQVDLSGVTFFSAAGVSWLVGLLQRATGDVQVAAASEPVRELLALCGVPITTPGATEQRPYAQAT